MTDNYGKLQHNLITTNMFTKVDLEGTQFLLLDEILDYRKLDLAIEKRIVYHIRHNRNQHKVKTTEGYEFYMLWRDRSTKRIPL